MTDRRLSRLQRRILTWLLTEERRTRGTHQNLTRALAHDKGNLSTRLKGLGAKGWLTITRMPGGAGRGGRGRGVRTGRILSGAGE
jgi:hypothetical protein